MSEWRKRQRSYATDTRESIASTLFIHVGSHCLCTFSLLCVSLSSLLFARLSQANNTLTQHTFATVSSSEKRKCVLGEERTFTPLFQHTRKKSGVVGLVGSGVSGHAVMGGGGKHDGGGVFLAACWTLYLVYEYIYIRMRVCVCVYVRMRACV
jgi:hypothetical protein